MMSDNNRMIVNYESRPYDTNMVVADKDEKSTTKCVVTHSGNFTVQLIESMLLLEQLVPRLMSFFASQFRCRFAVL